MQRRVIAGFCLALVAVSMAWVRLGAYEFIAGFQPRPTMPVVVYINPQNNDVSADAAEAVLVAGMNLWNTVTGTTARFVYGGRVSDTSIANDGRDVVIFRDAPFPGISTQESQATTYVWSDATGQRLVETDTVYWDGSNTFFTGSSVCSGSNGVYLEDVAAHEFGHMLGLDDSFATIGNVLMHQFPFSGSYCSVRRRTLSQDDIAAVRVRYPAGPNTPPTVKITSPAGDIVVTPGTRIDFAASAFDQEEGDIGRRVIWSSSIIGEFFPEEHNDVGPGIVQTTALPPGVHVITALIYDGNGATATDTVTVTVANPVPSVGSVNVAAAAAGATASASSFYSSDFSPAFVIDGKRAGPEFWNDATPGSYPDILEIDFASTYTINQVNVFSVQDNYTNPVEPSASLMWSQYGVRAFSVEYWTGSAWTPIPGASVTSNNLVWKAFSFDPISTQRIRVVVTSAAASYSRLTEVEAFTAGSPPGPSQEPPPNSSTNVAAASMGALATASSFYSSDFSPASVNDGNRAGPAFWNDATFGDFPDSLEIDFAGSFTIGQVNVFSVQDNYANPSPPTTTQTFKYYGVTDFTIEYWTGTAWAPIPGAVVTGNSLVWRSVTFSPVTTTKIRVVITGSPDGFSRLTEVEAYTVGAPAQPPPSNTNVAAASRGAVVAASSFYSTDFDPASVIDGNRAGPAFWNDATFNSFPDTLEIDFASTFTIGQVNVFSVQDNYNNPSPPTPTQTFTLYGVRDFAVQYWDGSNWVPIPEATVSNNSLVWRAISFSPVTTDRIRIVIIRAADGWSRLTEVEALTASP
jgi:hypothetical protein